MVELSTNTATEEFRRSGAKNSRALPMAKSSLVFIGISKSAEYHRPEAKSSPK